MSPNEAMLFRNRGYALLKIQKLDQAEIDFRRSLDLEPDSVRSNFFLGRLCCEMGKYFEAEKLLQKSENYENAYLS